MAETLTKEDRIAAMYGEVGRLLAMTHTLVLEVEQLKLAVRDLVKQPDEE